MLQPAPAGGTVALDLTSTDGAWALAADERVHFGRLDSDGAPRGEVSRRELPGARGLLALEDVAGRPLLLAFGSCREAAQCMIGTLLVSAPPSPSAPPARIAAPLPARLITSRRRASGSRLYVAWSAAGGHRGLEMWMVDEEGSLGRARRPLGPEPASEELPVEILGLAADRDRWAVLHRRGVAEDARSRVYLTTEGAHRAVEALHEVLVVDAIELASPDAVQLVAGFEFSRPHLLELPFGAAEPTSARPLAASASIPEPFAEHTRLELQPHDGQLSLARRDAAGDPLGPPVPIAEGTIGAATVARRPSDGAALVAWLDRDEDALRARWVRCD